MENIEASHNPSDPIEDLVNRSPSGPEFTEKTTDYIEESISLGLPRFRDGLITQFGEGTRATITELIDGISKGTKKTMPTPDSLNKGGGLYFPLGKGGSKPFNSLLYAAHGVSAHLTNSDYSKFLFQTSKIFDGEDGLEASCWTFPDKFLKLTQDHDLSGATKQILATGYMTQVGKIVGVDRARNFAKRAQVFKGVESVEHAEPFLRNLQSNVQRLRQDEAYIGLGLGRMTDIAKAAGYPPESVEFILDLAFMQDEAFSSPEQYEAFRQPYIDAIAQNNWEKAAELDDFMLKYLGKSFPLWRTRTYEETHGIAPIMTLADFKQAVDERSVEVDDISIPEEYRDFVDEKIAPLAGRTEQRRTSFRLSEAKKQIRQSGLKDADLIHWDIPAEHHQELLDYAEEVVSSKNRELYGISHEDRQNNNTAAQFMGHFLKEVSEGTLLETAIASSGYDPETVEIFRKSYAGQWNKLQFMHDVMTGRRRRNGLPPFTYIDEWVGDILKNPLRHIRSYIPQSDGSITEITDVGYQPTTDTFQAYSRKTNEADRARPKPLPPLLFQMLEDVMDGDNGNHIVKESVVKAALEKMRVRDESIALIFERIFKTDLGIQENPRYADVIEYLKNIDENRPRVLYKK